MASYSRFQLKPSWLKACAQLMSSCCGYHRGCTLRRGRRAVAILVAEEEEQEEAEDEEEEEEEEGEEEKVRSPRFRRFPTH